MSVTVQKRMANGWQLLSTYSFQHMPETRIGDLNNPNQEINSKGESALEVPHSFRMAGSYLLPKGGIQLSAMWNIQQGQPYNRTLNVVGMNQGTFSITADPTGTWRHDTQSQLDVRAEKQFRFGAARLVGLQLEAFNLFNNAASTIYGLVGNGTVTGGNFGRISGVMPPRTFRIGTRFTF